MNDSDRLVNPLNTMISSPFQANVYSPQFGHGRVSPPQPFNCYLGNCPLDRDLFEPHEEDEHPVISPAAIEKCQAFLTEINTLLESQTAPLKPISTDTREQVFEIGSRFQLTLKKESGSANQNTEDQEIMAAKQEKIKTLLAELERFDQLREDLKAEQLY